MGLNFGDGWLDSTLEFLAYIDASIEQLDKMIGDARLHPTPLQPVDLTDELKAADSRA